jgi:hypothetical protein
VTAEPSASVWEVTRLILSSPDGSPSAIAQEHGYSAAEIAELMPIFLDTARTDWSTAADVGGGWATPGPGAAEHDAELYLRDLAGSGSVEAAGAGDAAAPGAADGELLTADVGALLDGAEPGRPPAAPADGPADAPEPAVAEPNAEVPPAGGPSAPEPAAGTGVPVDGAAGTATPAEEPFALGDDDPFADDPFAEGHFATGASATDPFTDGPFAHAADDATSAGFDVDDVAGGPYPG